MCLSVKRLEMGIVTAVLLNFNPFTVMLTGFLLLVFMNITTICKNIFWGCTLRMYSELGAVPS